MHTWSNIFEIIKLRVKRRDMRKLLVITFSLLFAASTASALPISINGATGAAFQSWNTSNLNEENNNYYWDGKSGDGKKLNTSPDLEVFQARTTGLFPTGV